MKALKHIASLLSRLFESNWNYYNNMSVRVHKVTGEVQYDNWDDWGHMWLDTPMFPDTPLWGEK